MDIESLQNWFHYHVKIDEKPYKLDAEQAAIVLNEHKNVLVTARAGSGKTHTLIATIVYLIFYKHVDPSEIIAFAFNTKAAKQINEKLSHVKCDGRRIDLGEYGIGTTFHSFAMSTLPGYFSPLSDREKTNNNVGDRSFYIKKLLQKVSTKKIYDFIHNQSEPVKKEGEDDREYYLRIRNLGFDTLDGKKVRSYTEKIISDYLFEHDISYKNEIEYYPKTISKLVTDEKAQERLAKKEKIRPDFYLDDYNLVWENWGISGNESAEKIAEIDKLEIFDGGYRVYKSNMEWKKWFYKRDWLDHIEWNEKAEESNSLKTAQEFEDLIETYRNPSESREDFEKALDETLSTYGISTKKMTEEELLKKFAQNEDCYTRLAELVAKFIDRAEQQYSGRYDKLREACVRTENAEVRKFYEIAFEIFDIYLKELYQNRSDNTKKSTFLNKLFDSQKNYTIDFSLALAEAAEAIRGGSKCRKYNIDNLKYIFIDEFQDLSPLFYDLVKAIYKRVEDANLLCVGDDWQAINGFAGSDLRYFKDFETFFPGDNKRYDILKNHRSNHEIVELSNLFMSKMLDDDKGGISAHTESIENCLNSCYINKKHRKGTGEKEATRKGYNEAIMDIMYENKGKTIRILNREDKVNALSANSMTILKTTLKKLYEEKLHIGTLGDDEFECNTVHKAKGAESDIVIMIGNYASNFPIIHPDTKYFEVFGDNEEKVLDEEKRLFYVALTRAKEKIYIVRNDGNENRSNVSSEKDFFGALEMENFNQYRIKGISRRLILEGKEKKICPIGIKFYPNRNNPNRLDIIITTHRGDDIRIFHERPADILSLKALSHKIDEEHPKFDYELDTRVDNGEWIHISNVRRRNSSILHA